MVTLISPHLAHSVVRVERCNDPLSWKTTGWRVKFGGIMFIRVPGHQYSVRLMVTPSFAHIYPEYKSHVENFKQCDLYSGKYAICPQRRLEKWRRSDIDAKRKRDWKRAWNSLISLSRCVLCRSHKRCALKY